MKTLDASDLQGKVVEQRMIRIMTKLRWLRTSSTRGCRSATPASSGHGPKS